MKTIIALLMGLVIAGTASASMNWQEQSMAETMDHIQVPDGMVRDVLAADLTDAECMALNIYHEARGDGEYGMALSAQVTMVRVRADVRCYPNTACGAIRQPAQYSWTRDGKVDFADSADTPMRRNAADEKAWRRSYFMAIEFLYLGRSVDVPGVDANKLIHFHAVDEDPGWSDSRIVFAYRGHAFRVKIGRATSCYTA